jgi:hypothetical protein
VGLASATVILTLLACVYVLAYIPYQLRGSPHVTPIPGKSSVASQHDLSRIS